ncbi:MAG: immunoglobulin-like domain-containing protein, partial [Acholeplasmataceae bacterium]
DEAPARGFMFYYGTLDLATIRLYEGLEVTIDVVIYTYRTNNKAFAVYYVGGPEGVEANLTDQQKLDLDVAAITVPEAITEATTLELPTEGSNGSAIVWESNSELIDVATGAVTMPEGDAVSVKLTASIQYGTLEPVTKNYYINVGVLPTVTMAGLLEMTQGQLAYAEAEVFWIKSDGKAAILADETGAGYVYFGKDMRSEIEVGDYIGLSFALNIYYGLYQMGNPVLADSNDLVGEDPNLELTAINWTATEAQAFFDDSNWGPLYVTMTLTGYASGDYTNGTLEGFEPFIQTQGATSDLRDVQFTFTGWVIDRRSDKIVVEGSYTIIE